jgi:transmembrane sensor
VVVALSSKERTVTLHEGEAYFQVAKDQARRFKVHAGTADVTALGTAFNINRSHDSSTVTVVEGTVLVTPTAQRSQGAGLRGVRLKAGEQIIASNLSIGIPVAVSDLASVTSWQTGRLSFRKRPLREAIGDVNRYVQKPLVLAPEVTEIAVTGTLTINNIGGWINSLERVFDLRATEEPDRIVIRPRG